MRFGPDDQDDDDDLSQEEIEIYDADGRSDGGRLGDDFESLYVGDDDIDDYFAEEP
jgi:hypothetical protein